MFPWEEEVEWIEQRIPYTDFPLDEFSFYCVHNVMMLKSEY